MRSMTDEGCRRGRLPTEQVKGSQRSQRGHGAHDGACAAAREALFFHTLIDKAPTAQRRDAAVSPVPFAVVVVIS